MKISYVKSLPFGCPGGDHLSEKLSEILIETWNVSTLNEFGKLEK